MTSPAIGTLIVASSLGGDVPLIGALIAGGMYWLGGRRFRSACRRGTISPRRISLERWRDVSFTLGLAILLIALQEPFDHYADKLFWVHMVQHVLLLVVVAPLVILAAPWMRMWRALPLASRRRIARWAVKARSAAPLRGLAHVLGMPWVVWMLMSLDVIGWHVPAAYDITLRSSAAHYAEHASFLLLAILAWGQVIDSPPYHTSLDAPRKLAFALGQMVVGWSLALLLAFASRPWYSAYAALHGRPGGISAITDQHLAAGVMWVPASLPWSLLVFVLVYRWLADGTQTPRPRGDRTLSPVGLGPPERGPSRVDGGVVPPGPPREIKAVAGGGRTVARIRRTHA